MGACVRVPGRRERTCSSRRVYDSETALLLPAAVVVGVDDDDDVGGGKWSGCVCARSQYAGASGGGGFERTKKY